MDTARTSSERRSDILESGEEFLQHYGVKGMHWGVITKGRNSPFGKKTKKKSAGSSLTTKEIKKRNERLRQSNERLRLEQEHKKLRAASATGATAAVAFVGALLVKEGQKHIATIVSNQMSKQVKDRIVNPGPMKDKMVSTLLADVKKGKYG